MNGEVRWTFYGYRTPSGACDVQEWFDGLTGEERDEASDTILYLRVLPLESWGRPPYALLGGGLSEIRFKVNSLNRTYRIYGFFWPGGQRYVYTLLLGHFKKVKNPEHEIAIARKRKEDVEQGRTSIHEFRFTKRTDRPAKTRPAVS